MITIEGTQIRTNPDNLVVFMSDWTRWIEFVEKGYFVTREILIDGGWLLSDTRIFLKTKEKKLPISQAMDIEARMRCQNNYEL